MKTILCLLGVLIFTSFCEANPLTYDEITINDDKSKYTLEIHRFNPVLEINQNFKEKNETTILGLYRTMLHSLKVKDFKTFKNIHIDQDQAEAMIVNFKKDSNNKLINKILKRNLESKITAIIKSGKYYMLLTEQKSENKSKYSMTCFIDENNKLKIIAVPYYYMKRMPNLFKTFNLLSQGKWHY